MYRARAEGITFTKEPYIEDVGPRRIKSMKFTALSDSEISKIAEVQVWKNSYYDQTRKPIEGGLLDPRMGLANASDKSGTCATCHAKYDSCPGHYGYLELALPVYHVGYLGVVLQILKCICKGCARTLIDEDLRKERLKKMRSPKLEHPRKIALAKTLIDRCSAMTSSKAVKCLRCGFINGRVHSFSCAITIGIDLKSNDYVWSDAVKQNSFLTEHHCPVKKAVSMLGIIHDTSKCIDGNLEEFRSAISHTKEAKAPVNLTTHLLDPLRVLFLFKRMPDEDCELLYLADRPEKFILTNIAVPPIAIRPSAMVGGSHSNENEITERLKQIIQANANLRQELQEASGAFKCLV
ncbi:DNA-directed RNA polymerase III subunit 1 isoform X2 [Senna tora]|uniref:DNA-directed RNA polymerase n=1 Tax=Senna tora TaxID=362788 RepID=A0A834SQQ6_9FABA|nr:DNA-directed RNA polymerase III subunit 1 isoform X2 [Senna tora]